MSKIKPKECQNVEFKSSWNDKYLEWICGFANAQGAVMYFGVNDDHEVVGLKDTKKLLEDIPNKVVNYLGIVVDVNLYEQDGLEYIEVMIEPSNVPISYRGKYYYRSGSTMQELNGTSLQQFVLKKMGRSWDDVTLDRAKLDDIDRDAIDYFLRKGIDAQRIPEDQRNAPTLDVLTSLGLIDEDGGLKNAAILLFGKKPQRFFPSVMFKIGRFGRNDADLMFQDVIEGNIIQMADHVMNALQSKYLVSPIRFEGMNRIERLEIPKEALREVLYNAIAHKDYTGSDIQMHVYDDRVEIWNEGELPAGYDQETLFARHSSKPRNRNIANAFFKAGFIDTWGRGFQKIRDGFEAAGIPMPKVENFCGGVRVTILRTKFMQMMNVTSDVTSNVVSDVSSLSVVQLTDRQEKIRELILKDSFISAQQMSVVLSVVTRTIWRDLADLQKKGVLIREGNTSAGHWIWVGPIADNK
jgi:ATP-dependent DNA helicase RecG